MMDDAWMVDGRWPMVDGRWPMVNGVMSKSSDDCRLGIKDGLLLGADNGCRIGIEDGSLLGADDGCRIGIKDRSLLGAFSVSPCLTCAFANSKRDFATSTWMFPSTSQNMSTASSSWRIDSLVWRDFIRQSPIVDKQTAMSMDLLPFST